MMTQEPSFQNFNPNNADQNHPLITIGITCYNAEQTIERAINSALKQEWPNVEIIIADDRSTDNSLDVLYNIARGKDKFRVIALSENRGVAAARNAILENASGEFLAFFDDDDESEPLRLSRQYERIVNYESTSGADLVICHTARLLLLPDGTKKYEPTLGMNEEGVAPHGFAVADQILIGRPAGGPVASCATCSQMARKSTYESVNGFNEDLRRSEDTDLNVRLALAGAHFVGIEEPLVKQHLTFTSEKKLQEEHRCALLWLENNRAYLESIGWYKHACEWLDIKYDYLTGNKIRFFIRLTGLFLKSPWKTVSRLSWTWPNRKYSSQVSGWHDKYYNANTTH